MYFLLWGWALQFCPDFCFSSKATQIMCRTQIKHWNLALCLIWIGLLENILPGEPNISISNQESSD